MHIPKSIWCDTGRRNGACPASTPGEPTCRSLAGRLQGLAFSAVWSSPSQRASKTCALAGFGDASIIKDDLAEWDYGTYEGITTKAILAERPGWQLFRDSCPGGESAADVGARADRIIHAIRAANDRILIFSSSHFLRVLTARWLGLPPEGGALFVLDTTSISVLGYEHDLTEPVVRMWNQT